MINNAKIDCLHGYKNIKTPTRGNSAIRRPIGIANIFSNCFFKVIEKQLFSQYFFNVTTPNTNFCPNRCSTAINKYIPLQYIKNNLRKAFIEI